MIQNGGSQSKPESAQLFNHYKGRSESAWQLDETVDNFLKRLPPVGHNNFFGPWIYIANPWEKEESYTGYEQFEYTEFLARGKEVLQAYDDKIRHLVEKNPDMKAGAVTRRLGPDRDQLKKDLFEVASKCKITSGKVSYNVHQALVSATLIP